MSLEDIKRDFIEYMEKTRRKQPYPSKFFGCVMAILVESEPITQNRITELTGYPQPTVSLVMQKVQMFLPIRITKKVGEKTQYYSYDGSLEKFILDIWNKRLETSAIDHNLIDETLEKARKNSDRGRLYTRFARYLENLSLHDSLAHTLRSRSIQQYIDFIESKEDNRPENDENLPDTDSLQEFLSQLRQQSLEYKNDCLKNHGDGGNYLEMKREFFTKVKLNLDPFYSQDVANTFMILHNVFLEGCTTQEQIEASTSLPRSTISQLLSEFTNPERVGILKIVKKKGVRKKIYQPAVSFTEFILGYFKQFQVEAASGISRLSEYLLEVRKLKSDSKGRIEFLKFLKDLKSAYLFSVRFAERIRIEFLQCLKKEYDAGFDFI